MGGWEVCEVGAQWEVCEGRAQWEVCEGGAQWEVCEGGAQWEVCEGGAQWEVCFVLHDGSSSPSVHRRKSLPRRRNIRMRRWRSSGRSTR